MGLEQKFVELESDFSIRIEKKLEIITREMTTEQKFIEYQSSGVALKVKEKLALLSQELGIDQKFIEEKSSNLAIGLDAISIATILQ